MSEYIEIESESTDNPAGLLIHTNLNLAPDGRETYASILTMEEGSPLAQMLSTVAGIQYLVIESRDLEVTYDLDVPRHIIIADIRT